MFRLSRVMSSSSEPALLFPRSLVFTTCISGLLLAVGCSNEGPTFSQSAKGYHEGADASASGDGRGAGAPGSADAQAASRDASVLSNGEKDDDGISNDDTGNSPSSSSNVNSSTSGTANNGTTTGTGNEPGGGTTTTGGGTTTTGGGTTTTGGGTTTTGGGTGTEPNPATMVMVTKQLVQPSPGKVDILWVVDSSGSMSEEQSYLGSNFSAFINQLAATGADFQTAVTSTDICDDVMPSDLALRTCPVANGGSAATRLRGSFRGDVGRKVLKKGDSDIFSRFPAYASVGINGSGFEHGLKAAEMAVTKSLNGQNEALVRSDAFLAVIVVSDEEDDGIGLGMNEPGKTSNYVADGLTTFRYTDDNFIDYLKVAKGAGKFSVSAITGTKNADGTMCTSAHSKPKEEGTQYIKAAQKTGGVIQSICEPNWNDSLAKIGLDLNAQQTQITLEANPDTATIKVWVNDVFTTAWSYNMGNNAVKFDANAVPPPGAVIKVQYYRAQ